MNAPLGQTRTRVARNHAFVGPDSHVSALLPGWTGTQGVVLVAPAMGAGVTQYLAHMEPGGTAAPLGGNTQRFVMVRDGTATLHADGSSHALGVGHYAYLPPALPHELKATEATTLLIFETRHDPRPDASPTLVVGHPDRCTAEPFMGDDAAMLMPLLPGDAAMDLAVNLFTFEPGAALPLVESHHFEHGLFMLRGQGVYRLDDDWYPCQAGDAIWMGPFCPQWFCAIGKEPAQYLYSKNVNRDAAP